MRQSIRFLLGDQIQELTAFDPQMTVLDWLRTRVRRTGTKEGCAEGDCGACTVTVGELHDGRLRYRAINACIALLPTLDGKQLLTVEDLARQDMAPQGGESLKLHPVQQAMVDQHGSQCGFCTPGFVMSLFTLYHDRDGKILPGKQASKQIIDRAIAGNLCRCTGYAPIVRAAQQALSHAADDKFNRDESQTVKKLKSLESSHSLQLQYQERRYFAPRSLTELWQLMDEFPGAQLVAGATDVGLWITKQLQIFDTIISLGEVQELKQIGRDKAGQPLKIGAMVSYSDALDILVEHYPGMSQMLYRLGAEQVRNAGTIGGNIANGSPIGDMPPALIALGARLIVSSSGGRRELPLEDFFLEYGKQDLRQGECVESVLLPPIRSNQYFSVYKISKRFDQDISALCCGFLLTLSEQQVTDIRICFGGMAGTPLRALKTEQALLGKPWCAEVVAEAQQALAQDYTPLTDWRASAQYRLLAGRNLLQRFFLETTSDDEIQLVAGSSG